jgi:hypothetical protein
MAYLGKSKPRKGRHVATAIDCPQDIDALYAGLLNRLEIRDPTDVGTSLRGREPSSWEVHAAGAPVRRPARTGTAARPPVDLHTPLHVGALKHYARLLQERDVDALARDPPDRIIAVNEAGATTLAYSRR